MPKKLNSGIKRNKIFINNKNKPITVRQKVKTAKPNTILKTVSIILQINYWKLVV